MNKDVPIIIDLNKLLVGSYAGIFSDKGQTNDLVYLEYYPFNGFFGKPRRYPSPVKRDTIHFLPGTQTGEDGIPFQITLVYNPESDLGFGKFLRDSNARRIIELNNTIKDLKTQIAQLKQENMSAKAGVASGVAEARKINSKATDDENNNPLNRFSAFRQF